MPVIYSNNASTSLSAGINSSVTTIPIASSSGFPTIGTDEYYFATIANTANTKIEVVKVTAGTTSLTVTRAQGGTSAQAFDSGDNFQLRVTADTLEAATKTDVNITGGSIATAAIADDAVTAAKLANSINTDIATGVTGNTTANAALPKAGGTMTGNLVMGTNLVDGIDISARDAVLTSTTTTAGAALPKAGGTMTGDLILPDNVKLEVGSLSGGDLQIYHNSSAGASYIKDVGTGSLQIGGSSQVNILNGADTEYCAKFITDGAVELYHNNVKKLETTAAGATVTGVLTATLQANAIDSDHYTDASIDLAHMSSESVDEDNLHISNAGTNGFFLQKQSGNNGGLTWAEVPEGEDFIPNGSVMAFFQAAAPTGWTKVTTQNDKVLRVVSGNGGGTGGDWAMSAGETTSEVGAHTHTSAAHTHTGASHTHTGASHTHGGGNLAAAATTISTSTMPSHTHTVPYGSGNTIYGANGVHYQPYHNPSGSSGFNTATTNATGGGGSHSHNMSGNTAATTPGNGGATTPGAGGSTTPGATGSANAHTHTIQAPQYIDVIICSKDA